MDASAQELIETATPLVLTWGLQVVGAIVLLVVGRMAAGAIRSAVRRALERGQVDESLIPFVCGLAYWAALAVVIIAVLGLFGIQTTSLVAILGAAGLAVGLALQGTLSNFSAGVMLLIFRPFRVGDWIEAAGVAGSVQQIGVFATTLHTGDNVLIVVPNSTIQSDIIKNYSANDTRRIDLVLGISYDDDIEKAIATVKRVVQGDARVLPDPAPVVAVGELADSSVNLLVRPWCAAGDYWALRWDLTRALKEELEAAGCSIPYPQQDVHWHGAETPPAA